MTYRRILPFVVAAALTFALSGCGVSPLFFGIPGAAASPAPSKVAPSTVSSPAATTAESSSAAAPPEVSGDTAVPPPSPESEATSEPPPTENLVEFTGAVEHLFFHPVIAYPQLAFDGDKQEKGLDEYMVTADEYKKMLQSLYDNDYILVNMNDVWHEESDDTDAARMVKSTLMVPAGKKPIILSYDDVCYYKYMLANGFTYKLVIKDGALWSYGLDPAGNPVYSQDLDAVTILDKFVAEHPDFSLNGAKGCLCLTGYEGILGYRTMTDRTHPTPEKEAARQKEIEAVKPIVALLKETGWYFGSHSWGHISLAASSLPTVQNDTERWLDEVGSLVGPTVLYIYPFGARPDGDDVKQSGPIFKYLQSKGFRVFASVGINPYSKIKTDLSAVICDRMHADGLTLRLQRERYLKFYDAKLVFDSDFRPDYGTKW